MRNSILSLPFVLLSVLLFGQNENPYAQFGYEAPIMKEQSQQLNPLLNRFVLVNTDTASSISMVGIDVENKKLVYINRAGLIAKMDTLDSYSMARWFSIDPKNQFSSPYTGMGSNPVMMVDPDGKFAWFIPIIIGAVVGGTSQGIATANNGGNFFDGFWKGAVIGGLAGAGGAGISALGGGAMLAGAGAGFFGGAGFSGLATNWDAGAMLRGGLIGGASGLAGGGFASAIGGSAGALVGGVASDVTGQLLSTGDVNLLQAGLGGALSFGMYHGMSKLNYELGGKKFDDIDLTYKEFKTIQAENQRARFWHKEHGVMLLRNGNPIVADRQYRLRDGINWPSSNEMGPAEVGIDIDNIKAYWHSHWSNDHLLGFSSRDLSNPYNQMMSNRLYSNVNYNHFDHNYNSIMTQQYSRVNDNFMRYFLFPY